MGTAMGATWVGINGFGRIGRQVARIAMKDPEVELKLINASYDAEYLAYQMKYDSIHGRYDGTIEADGDSLVIDGVKVALSHTRDPAEIPFTEHGAEYVCESTGVFPTTEKIAPHLKAGAKKVVFSAPAKDDSHTVVMGVNEDTYKSSMTAVSCASCTTNGLAPMVKAVNDAFGIKRGLMTTVHAMTASQPTVDGSSKKDWRGQGRGQGDPVHQGQADRHGLPRANHRRLRRGLDLRAGEGDELRGDLRRDQEAGRGRHEGLLGVHR